MSGKDKFALELMWSYFAEGLGGDAGYNGKLSLDWLSIGRIQGLRSGRSSELWKTSAWMFDFSWHKISLEG